MSEAPAVGHYSRHRLDLYTGIYILVHVFRMEVEVEKRWSVTASELQAWTHTLSIAFRHLPPNSARFSYATEGALFISVQLSSDAVSALRKVWVLIGLEAT